MVTDIIILAILLFWIGTGSRYERKTKRKSSAFITTVVVLTRSRLAIDSTLISLNPSFDSDSKGICLDELLQCLVRIGFGYRVGWVVVAVNLPNLK